MRATDWTEAATSIWRGRLDLVALGVAAFETLKRAQAQLQALKREQADSANVDEQNRLAHDVEIALAWINSCTEEFMMIEALMDPGMMQKLWEAIRKLDSSSV
jgi:hypothetical protein